MWDLGTPDSGVVKQAIGPIPLIDHPGGPWAVGGPGSPPVP